MRYDIFFQLVGLGMKGASFLKSRKHIGKFDCNTKRLYSYYCIVWTFKSGLRNSNSNRLISNTYRFETLGLLIYLKTVFWQGVDVGSTNKTKLIADGVWVRPRRSMSELVSKSSRVTLPVLFLTQMAIWFINILIYVFCVFFSSPSFFIPASGPGSGPNDSSCLLYASWSTGFVSDYFYGIQNVLAPILFITYWEYVCWIQNAAKMSCIHHQFYWS